MSTILPEQSARYPRTDSIVFETDFISQEWEERLKNGELPHETYDFVGTHHLTQRLDMGKLMPHDVLDEDHMPVKLELEPATLTMISEKINEAFSYNPKNFDYDAFVAERVMTTARHLRPKLVKEEAAARTAGNHLDNIFTRELKRKADALDVNILDLERSERYRGNIRPSEIISVDFELWSRDQWPAAREEAVDLLASTIDPAYATEFQYFAGRDVEIEPIAALKTREKLHRFGRSVVGRLGIAAI